MELSIHPGLLALPVKFIESALKANSRTGRYHAVKADADTVSFTITREDLVVRAILDAKKVSDPQLLAISKSGLVVVNGASNAKIVLKNHSKLPIHIKFDERKKAKATPKDGTPSDADAFDEVGTLTYGIIGDTGKKWRATLQSLFIAECDPSIDIGDKKADISGADLQNYAKFVGAYGGKNSMSTSWSNALIRMRSDASKGDEIQFVTTNGQQIGLAKFRPIKSYGEFKCIIPAEALQEVARLTNPELDVSIHVKSGSPGAMSFVQKLTYGNGEVGMTIIRVLSSAEKFHNFEGPIDRLNLATTIKLKAQALKNACDMLDVIERVKTRAVVDATNGQVILHKEGDEGVIDDLPLGLISASGNNLELDVSSRHLQEMAGQAKEEDEMTIQFSGRTSMAKATLDEHRQVFFAPFRDA